MLYPAFGYFWRLIMNEQTCAACDYKLDDTRILVNIGGKPVEVCCEECATKLREAEKSAKAATRQPANN